MSYLSFRTEPVIASISRPLQKKLERKLKLDFLEMDVSTNLSSVITIDKY
jgi:hypothetical protein